MEGGALLVEDTGWAWGVDPAAAYQFPVPVYEDRDRPFRTVTEAAVRPFTDAMGLYIEGLPGAVQVPWQCEGHEVVEARGRRGLALHPESRPVLTSAVVLSHMLAPWPAAAQEPFTVAKWRAEERYRAWAEGEAPEGA